MLSFAEWSRQEREKEKAAQGKKILSFEEWSKREREAQSSASQPTYQSQNAAADRSGLGRDAFDASVRNSYAAKQAEAVKTAATGGGFYDPTELLRAGEGYRSFLETANSRAEQLYTQLTAKQKQLEKIYAVAMADPLGAGAAAFETERQNYLALYSAFGQAKTEAEKALSDYNGYAEKLNAWKSTVRDKDAVRAELASVEAQIRAAGTGSGAQLEALQKTQALLQDELWWSYANLRDSEDFAEKSGYVSTYAPGTEKFNAFSGSYTNSGFGDILYDYINKNETAMSRQQLAEIADNRAFLGLDEGFLRQMTEDEVATFNYLYAQDEAAGDKEHKQAYDYVAFLKSELTGRQRAADTARWRDYAKENPAAASAVSVALSPLKGLSYLGQAADIAADGTLDRNAGYNKFSDIPGSIRSQVSETIEKSGKWGKVGSFLYNTGLSMGDFLFSTAATGGFSGVPLSGGLSLAIMGTGAAADAVNEAKDRGLSDKQAFALGTAAGAAEIVMEKIGLDELLKSMGSRRILRSALKNALAEGGEEAGTEIINTLADVLIAQDKSKWQTAINAYMEQGLSEGEAMGRAFVDKLLETGAAALGGGLSGGILGGVTAGVELPGTKRVEQAGQAVQRLGDESVEEMLRVGLRYDKNSETYKLAQKLQKQMESGKTVDAYDVGSLLEHLRGQDIAAGAEDTGTVMEGDESAAGTELEKTAIRYGVKKSTYERVRRLSEAVGRNVVFYEGEMEGEDGFFDRETDTIHINARSGNAVAQILSHELTHNIEGTEGYGELRTLVLSKIEASGRSLAELKAEKARNYARRGVRLTETGAEQEIVAEYVAKNLLTNEQEIRALTQENPSLGRRILYWLEDVLAKLGNVSAQEKQQLRQMRGYYAAALQEQGVREDAEISGEQDDVLDRTLEEVQFSIEEIEGRNGNYGVGVLLDTNIFDGIRTHDWGGALKTYVYKNLAGTELTVYDETGNTETIYFARENDRVKKDGAKHSHKVIDKLARYKGDNIRALATVHLPEALATSKNKIPSNEHSHQWMDEKGWIYRTAYLQDKDGNIYKATLNIADGRDRRILYDITNIRKIDTKKEATGGVVSSTKTGRDSHTNGNFQYSITDKEALVKQKMREAQFAVIQQSNPPTDTYHTWIRSADEVKTFAEVLADPEWDYDDFDPDYTREMAEQALQSGEIFVYSSYPISDGVFVTPSAMEALSYSGNGNVYGKKVKLEDVAWIDPTQGQYAPVDERQLRISERTDKRQVAADLRAMLNRGGSASELRRYVDDLDGGKRVDLPTYAETEAEALVRTAHGEGLSVDEYLRQNWESYEYDGQLNETARKALELERRQRRVQYSISEDFEKSFDEWTALQKPDRKKLLVGTTSEALKSIGVEDKKIYWDTSKINKIQRDHKGMTDTVLKQVPYILEYPILVMESKTQPNRVTMYGEVYNALDVPVLAVLELLPTSQGEYELDEMKVANAYGKGDGSKESGIKGTQSLINTSNILYVEPDKKRTDAWLSRNQLQLPLGITSYGPIDRVAYVKRNVNREISAEPKTTEMPEWKKKLQEYANGRQFSFEDGTETTEELLEELTRQREEMFDGYAESMTDSDRELRQRDLDEYYELIQKTASATAEREQANVDDKVSTETGKREQGRKEKLREAYSLFIRKLVDSGEAVQRIGKATGDRSLYHFYNMARASSNAATDMILGERTDIRGRSTGEGLNQILDPIRKKGDDYYRKFQLYLFHMHNVDRMSRFDQTRVDAATAALEEFRLKNPELMKYSDYQLQAMANNEADPLYFEAGEYMELLQALRRAENTKNKPVFGFEVSAEDSRAAAGKLERENADFKDEAAAVYGYIDNLLRYRVDSGLITEEDYQKLKAVYPHYVPTFREFKKEATDQRRKGRVQIGSTVKRAEGGKEKLMPLHKALAQQTLSVVREGSKNRFGQRLMDSGAEKKASELVRSIEKYSADFDESRFDRDEEAPKKRNTFVVRENGKLWEIEVAPALYEAVEVLSPEAPENNVLLKAIRKGNDVFKGLVTGYNPMFLVRNFVRDFQDAGLYSKDTSELLKRYPEAWKEIAANGEYWRQYKALGGTHSTIFDYETGTVREKKGAAKAVDKVTSRIEALNMAVEQAPRLAEFMATVKKAEKRGEVSMEDLMEAMYNAADVTVNFGRSGTLGKALNANFVPFLNPGIQGFDKMVRNVTETRGAKNWVRLIVKSALLGVAPAILNSLLYRDDEEWDSLKDRDKDVNYLFKLGDGLWVKVPKGRTLSILGMTADRALRALRGEDVDWAGYIETAVSQTAPANPLENNIAQAWFDTKLFDSDDPGETWYGTDIESQRLQNYAPEERYDAGTDKLSRFLGKTFGLSPAKINYLLDQYTGVVGDILLPLLSPEAEQNAVISSFTINTTRSNRYSNDFYDMLNELTYAKNKTEATAADTAAYRYFNAQSQAVSDVNKAIREIEADENLSAAEKRELSDVQYALRNEIMRQALENVEGYRQTAQESYEGSALTDEDDKLEEAYHNANRETVGAEYALQKYSKAAYEKAQKLNEESGIGYDSYYDIVMGIDALEPTAGRKQVSDLQKWEVVGESSLTKEKQMAVLETMCTDDQYRKFRMAYEEDIEPRDFVAARAALERFDEDGNGSYSNDEVKAALDSFGGKPGGIVLPTVNHITTFSNRQKAVLWQLLTGSTSGKNNPYSRLVGQNVAEAVKAEKEAAKTPKLNLSGLNLNLPK